MYRDGKEVITHTDHRFVINNGALGDMITSLPAIIFAMKNVNSGVKLTVYVPPWQVDLVRHLLAPYGVITVGSMNDVPATAAERQAQWGDDVSTSINGAFKNTFTRNRCHMTDYAFNFLLDARPESMAQRNYPTEAPLGKQILHEPYIVFPTGATSDNKLFRATVMAPIIEWVVGRGYTPVLAGTKMSFTRAQMGDKLGEQLVIRDEVDKLPDAVRAQCLDMREKTTLLELRDLLGHAEAVVSVDGGTTHLAGTTDAPIIYAMGTTLPSHRYVTRNGNPHYKIKYVGPRGLECTGCQSRAVLTRWDFRFCPFSDNACMGLLHPDDFVAGLKELGL